MNFELNAIFSFSIALPVIISWVRFYKISPAYYPFVLLLWIGLVSETISAFIIYKGHSNVIIYNIYSIIEVIFITWQFDRWKLFGGRREWFYFIIIAEILVWLGEVIMAGSLQSFNSYFLIIASFAIVLMSISMINFLLYRVQESLLKNSIFLICLGFVFYFTYAVLVEAFWIYGLTENSGFVTSIYTILVYVNLFTNLLYALAVIWMPTKPKFILPF